MDFEKIVEALIKALMAEIKTPVGWFNILCVAAAFYLWHRRTDEYDEMLKGLLAQGFGYSAAVERAKVLLDRHVPEEAILGIILLTLLFSFILAYRAYIRSLPKP